MVEFANFWLPIIGGGIFIAWGITAYYSGSKIVGIWALFAGAVCLLLLGALQWQQSITPKTDADNSNIIAQRAYLTVDKVSILPDWKPGEPLTVEAIIKNTGQTPALNVADWYAVLLSGFPPPPSGLPAVIPPPSPRSNIGRDAIVRIRGTIRSPTDQERADMMRSTAALYFWGEITYKDAFGKSRYTRFRYYMSGLESRGLFFRPLGTDGNEAN